MLSCRQRPCGNGCRQKGSGRYVLVGWQRSPPPPSTALPVRGYGRGYRLRGARITVCEAFDGTLTLLHQDKVLDYSILQEGERPIPLDDEKSVHHTVDQARILQAQRPSGNPLPTILGVAIPPQNPLPDPPQQEDISALLKRDICELG